MAYRFLLTSFGPIVASTRLAENEVVRSEECAEGPRLDGIHGTGFQVDEDSTGDILGGCFRKNIYEHRNVQMGAVPTSSFIVVDADAL